MFPVVRNAAEFVPLCRDEQQLGPGVAAICDRLRIRESPSRFEGGSLPVYALGDELVLKIFPPYSRPERDRESSFLELLEGRLPVPTPAVRAVGELDGWGYLLMTRLRGRVLADVWPEVTPAEQEQLANDLGEMLAVLHSIRRAQVVAPFQEDFAAYLEGQRRSVVERQRGCNLGSPWLEQIPEFLASVDLGRPPNDCLLHTEVMREHLLVERGSKGWSLSGLIDFEPSMNGAPEYEFAPIGIFFSYGEPRLLRRVLLAYGYAESALDVALERRLLAYALLHRFSNFAWYLDRLPPPSPVTNLESLAEHWFGVVLRRGAGA